MSNKSVVNVAANGYEVEKIRKPYGAAPRGERKPKKVRRTDRKTVRYE